MEFNCKKDARIDEMALDVEWLEQPELMRRYMRRAAAFRLGMDTAEGAMRLVKARLDSLIRRDPESFALAKVTEGAIAGAILQDPRYQQARDDYDEAKLNYACAEADVQAIKQRKSALENLVRLHGQSYFAGPKVPRDLSEQRKARDRNRDVSSGMRRRRRS